MSILVPIPEFVYLLLDEVPVQLTFLFHFCDTDILGHILSNYFDSEVGLKSLNWPMSIFEYSLEGKGLIFLFVCVHLSSRALLFPHSLVTEDEILNIINEFFP